MHSPDYMNGAILSKLKHQYARELNYNHITHLLQQQVKSYMLLLYYNPLMWAFHPHVSYFIILLCLTPDDFTWQG
jgi:hypothetical protein